MHAAFKSMEDLRAVQDNWAALKPIIRTKHYKSIILLLE